MVSSCSTIFRSLILFLLASCAFAQLGSNRINVIPNAADAAVGEIRLYELRGAGTNYFTIKTGNSLATNRGLLAYASADDFITLEPTTVNDLTVQTDSSRQLRLQRPGGDVWLFTDDTGAIGHLMIGYSGGGLPLSTRAKVEIATGATGNIGIIVKAKASQTADLSRWVNSSETPLAWIGPSGEINQGGISAPAVSAAGTYKLYFDSGTNKAMISENTGAFVELLGSVPPFTDATAIIKGSVTTSKLLRIEVDGLTAATTRVWTVQDASLTVAGIDLAQTWTANQTFRSVLFSANNTYDVGSTGTRPAKIWTVNLDVSGTFSVAGFDIINSSRQMANLTSFTMVGTLDASNIYATAGVLSYTTGITKYGVADSNILDSSDNARFATVTIGSTYSGRTTVIDASRNLVNITSCTGCSPESDATAIVKGSVTASKLLRIEVDGITAATTRVWTAQDANLTVAGIDLAQTWTANQTYAANILASGTRDIGSSGTAFNNAYLNNLYISGNQIINSSRVMANLTQFTMVGTLDASNIYATAGVLSYTTGISKYNVSDSNILDSSDNARFATVTIGSNYSGRTTVIDASRNLVNIGTATFAGATTHNGGLTTGSSTNSTIYIGSGSLYNRVFSGGDASCGGVTDGWFGVRTDTAEVQICIGGNMKKVGLI